MLMGGHGPGAGIVDGRALRRGRAALLPGLSALSR